MNIKVKAGLEVAVGITVLIGLMTGARILLDRAAEFYGPATVFNGIIFVLMSTAAYVIVGLLYDIRVNQLKYKEKLEEIVKK